MKQPKHYSIIIFLIVGLLSYSCNSSELYNKTNSYMSKHKTNTINMVDLYPFAWDTLYVFQSKGQGIIRPKKYNRFLDPYFISCPEEMDLNKTIVFTYHTKIVHKETINEYPAFDSDLIPLNFDLNHKNQIEIPRDSATFTIESYPYSEKYLGYILTYPQIIH